LFTDLYKLLLDSFVGFAARRYIYERGVVLKMVDNRVCAVVVTFHPESSVSDNLFRVRSQVDNIIVIDNGSSAEALSLLRSLATQMCFSLVENGENLGIAAALNIGVRMALAQGYRWISLFDQDSAVTDGFIDAMLRSYVEDPHHEKIAIICPRFKDPVIGMTDEPPIAKDGRPLYTITSGSLMPIEVFAHCGLFEEDLIIDRVDEEYCLRVRSLGYTLVLCQNATLIHRIGTPTQHFLFGKHFCYSTNHNAIRRYYITRNRFILLQRYWKQYPLWAYWQIRDFLKETAKVLLVEDDRRAKLWNTARGTLHAFLGRRGRL
jgi:rhamnosyltransferase